MQKKKRGSALLIMIAAIVLVSVLGIAVFSLTGTSSLNTVVYNNNKQAYYLAESGYRYAAGLYLNTENKDKDGTADDEKAEVLQNKIDGAEYTLPNGGKFSLTAYPYWLMPDNDYLGQTSATFHFPGQIPKDFGIPASGVMAYSHTEKEGEKIALFRYTTASIAAANKKISCTLGQRLIAGQYCDIKIKDALFLTLPLITQPTSTGDSTVGLQGDKLTLNLPSAKNNRCIPPFNGVFIWGADNSKEFLYKKAKFEDNHITLSGIRRMDGQSLTTDFATNITTDPAKAYLVFKRNLALTSKGETGTGEHDSVRTIDYNMPISNSSSEDRGELAKKEVIMDSEQKLKTHFSAVPGTTVKFETYSSIDDHTGQAIQSPGAAIIIVQEKNGVKMGQVDLRVREEGTNKLTEAQRKLRTAWKKNNHFLEYDVQAKLSSLLRLLYGATGLSIRVSGNGKEFLAMSFMGFYVPSLIYHPNTTSANLAGGTLKGVKGGQVLFEKVHCLGNSKLNRFYYYHKPSDQIREETQAVAKRVAIHPDDYAKIKTKFSQLNNATLILTDASGVEHNIGTINYPHLFDAWEFYKNYPARKFGPYEWANYKDFIPNEIKPLLGNHCMGSMNDWWQKNHHINNECLSYNFYPWANMNAIEAYPPYKIFQRLALVLWEQYEDADGNIKRRWLAAKDMTDDEYILGPRTRYDGRIIHDSTTLLIRIRESMVNGVKTNLINVFYGDKSRHTEAATSKPYDINRKAYTPGHIYWPSLSLDDWSKNIDYFTHIQSIVRPDGTLDKTTNWDLLNPDIKKGTGPGEIAVFEISNNGTLLISCHPSPDAPFNNSTEFSPEEEAVWQDRPEISFHGIGSLYSPQKKAFEMNDFGLRTVIGGEEGYLQGGFLPGLQR